MVPPPLFLPLLVLGFGLAGEVVMEVVGVVEECIALGLVEGSPKA